MAPIGPGLRGLIASGGDVGRSRNASAIARCSCPPNLATSRPNTKIGTPT
jgi:hypothetical protein